MTGSFSSKEKDDIHFIAESDAAIPLRVPVASRSVTNLCKVSLTSSSALCELAKPILQPLHTNLPSSCTTNDTKAHKISEKRWSEGVSMAFCRNAARTADGSHDDLNKYGLFSNRSRVINYSLNHEQTNQSLMSSFPSTFLMNSIISAALQAGPSFFNVASRKEKPLRVHPNCDLHNESAHAIRSTQLSKRSFLIPQITSPIVLMPENLTTLPDLNVTVPKVNNPDRDLSNCCSPSSKWSHHIPIPDDNVSESGWTIYLNQSTDLTPGWSSTELSHSNSIAGALSQVTRHLILDKSAQHKQHPVGRNLIANFEDFSMVSDASSGPEHPFLYQDTQEIFEDSAVHKNEFGPKVFTGVRIDDLMDDACASKISCENICNGLTSTGCRTISKRRKRDLLVKPYPALPDIPKKKEKPQVEDGETNCDSFEGSGDNLNIEHKSTDSQNDEGDLLDDRLEILQQLIPNCEKIDREEILAVAIDYVKSLEQKIKTFETSRTDMAAEHRSNAEAIENFSQLFVGLENAVEGTALQEKGLCLMPVSIFRKAL